MHTHWLYFVPPCFNKKDFHELKVQWDFNGILYKGTNSYEWSANTTIKSEINISKFEISFTLATSPHKFGKSNDITKKLSNTRQYTKKTEQYNC